MDEQPGQVIAPSSTPTGQTGPQQQPAGDPSAVAPAPAPQPSLVAPSVMLAQGVAVSTPSPVAVQPTPSQQAMPGTSEGAGWQSNDDNSNTLLPAGDDLPGDVSWTASEFAEHQKSTSWYFLLTIAALVAATIDFLFTRDFISTGVVIVAAVLFGAYAGHKPRTQQYYLSPQGLHIGEKLYDFQAFRNFSVVEEGSLVSIVFMPLRRFAPTLTIYLAPDIEDRVLDYLSEFLPFEQHQGDAVDGLLRRIRF